MTTSTTTAGTTMRAIIQEDYGEAENVLRLGRWLGGSDRQLRAVMLSPNARSKTARPHRPLGRHG